MSWNSGSRHDSRAGHPDSLRCSSLPYSRYARSSRLAIRAPRSGTYATIHAARTLSLDSSKAADEKLVRVSASNAADHVAFKRRLEDHEQRLSKLESQ